MDIAGSERAFDVIYNLILHYYMFFYMSVFWLVGRLVGWLVGGLVGLIQVHGSWLMAGKSLESIAAL